jgi:hypothetical protein
MQFEISETDRQTSAPSSNNELTDMTLNITPTLLATEEAVGCCQFVNAQHAPILLPDKNTNLYNYYSNKMHSFFIIKITRYYNL